MQITHVHGRRVEFNVVTYPTLGAQGAARTVARLVREQTGFRAKDVTCPSGVEQRVGASFQCHFTGPEGAYTAFVQIARIAGPRVDFNITTRPSR
jgi:hypothetical protein